MAFARARSNTLYRNSPCRVYRPPQALVHGKQGNLQPTGDRSPDCTDFIGSGAALQDGSACHDSGRFSCAGQLMVLACSNTEVSLPVHTVTVRYLVQYKAKVAELSGGLQTWCSGCGDRQDPSTRARNGPNHCFLAGAPDLRSYTSWAGYRLEVDKQRILFYIG